MSGTALILQQLSHYRKDGKNMDIKELLKVYSDTYGFLYENTAEGFQIIEADYAGLFDDAMKNDPDFKKTIQEAAAYRQDIFSSDRECAAIVLAYKIMERREMIKAALKTA